MQQKVWREQNKHVEIKDGLTSILHSIFLFHKFQFIKSGRREEDKFRER